MKSKKISQKWPWGNHHCKWFIFNSLCWIKKKKVCEIEQKNTLSFVGDSSKALLWCFFFTGLVIIGFGFFLLRTFFKFFSARTSDADELSLDATRSTVLSFTISDLDSLEILGEVWSCFALSACKCEEEIQQNLNLRDITQNYFMPSFCFSLKFKMFRGTSDCISYM